MNVNPITRLDYPDLDVIRVEAVSYTHLDVYKRQHPQKETQTQSTESEAETQKETPVVKSEISLEDYQKIQTELYACLLYTSRCV